MAAEFTGRNSLRNNPDMTESEKQLWTKVRAFEPDHPDDEFTFSGRLARENGWELEFALRTIDEYKRFMFLLCIAPHPLTPSDQVDQVWHLHLIYTRSYWEDFCRDTLGRSIHHNPTRGGAAEGNKFTDWYAKTLALYMQTFGSPPPDDIWPEGEKRFSDIHFRRVNLKKYYLIKKLF